MAINFPDSPSVDEIYSVGDKSWLWNGTYWEVQGSPTSTFSASDTAPASPNAGDIWYRSDTSQTLIYYDSTWVEIGHSANIANFLADADADTKIQLEESSDEDTIRFDIAGSEKMALNASSLTVYDSLSVGSGASASSFDASGSGANLMPSGTTAERPVSPTAGMFRFNETTGEPEWYSSAAGWVKFYSAPTVTATYLLVAGGGAGASRHAGGGGAGGFLSGSVDLSSGTQLTISIGAGGASSGLNGSTGGSGVDTTLAIGTSSYTAVGGGGGGDNNQAGLNGGSGGGAGERTNSSSSGGSGTFGQGNDGGGTPTTSYGGGGGGGGAGAAGGNGSGGNAGDGGIGLAASIITTTEASTYSVGEVSGSDVYFAGGGGGGGYTVTLSTAGAGGLGGGRDGSPDSSTPNNGLANTGGGGGGGVTTGSSNGYGGSGGSGIMIIRYPSTFSTSSISAGLTYSQFSSGLDTILILKAGTGTVTF